MINILLFLSIISINENTEVIPRDTLPVQNDSFWEKLGFGFGYSGGICYTGQDLRKSDGWKVLPWDLIAEQLYWLNSIEGSIRYPINEKWSIGVGGGYSWANISQSEYTNWQFELYPLWLHLDSEKWRTKIGYVYGKVKDPAEVSGSVPAEGTGKGIEVFFKYKVNKTFGFSLSIGTTTFHVKEYYSEGTFERDIRLYLNGIGISLNYEFKL